MKILSNSFTILIFTVSSCNASLGLPYILNASISFSPFQYAFVELSRGTSIFIENKQIIAGPQYNINNTILIRLGLGYQTGDEPTLGSHMYAYASNDEWKGPVVSSAVLYTPFRFKFIVFNLNSGLCISQHTYSHWENNDYKPSYKTESYKALLPYLNVGFGFGFPRIHNFTLRS